MAHHTSLASLLHECIGVTMRVNKHVILAKNRDRAYKPDLEVVHTRIDGTEVAYLHDIATDWSEGMNEYGIGIVNTALIVGYDEDEKKILKSGGKPSKDGARIRYALSKKTIEDVVEAVSSYQGGVKGHTIIASQDAVYTVETTSKHKAHIIKHKPGTFLVRTNHGDEYPDAGYTQADEPNDFKSSVARRDDAIALLRDVKTVADVLPAMRTQTHEPHSNLNVIRDTKKMSTSSQLLLDLTARTLQLDYIEKHTDAMKGVVTKLPKDYSPKITIQINKITDRDIHTLKEQAMSTPNASKLVSLIRNIRAEDYKGGQTTNCAYEDWNELSEDAEYDGRSVELNKPFRSNDGKHKFYVYVKNDKNNVIKLGFGDPNMEIKRDDPERRKAYRDRHNCSNPGPKWKAEYWSCRMWADKPVSKIAEAAMQSIHRIHNGDVVRGTYMNVPYTGFVATQRVHPTNHDIRIFTVKLDAPIVVHGTHMSFLTVNASDNPALASDRIALREASDSEQYQFVLHAETFKKLQRICHEINSGKGRAKGAYADRPGADRKLEVLPLFRHQHLSKAALIHLQNDGMVFLLVTVRPGQRPEQGDIAFVINGYNNQIINAHAYFSHRYTYHDVTGTVEHPDYDAMVSAAGL